MFTAVKIAAWCVGYVVGSNVVYAALNYVEDKAKSLNK